MYQSSKASRVQFDGPVFGIAFGKMYEAATEKIWFLETAVTYQALNSARGIQEAGVVPETVYNRNIDNSKIYSVYFTIGVLVL